MPRERLFFFRSPTLTDELAKKAGIPVGDVRFYESADGKLERLKDELRKVSSTFVQDYSTVDEFGKKVFDFLQAALDHHFPVSVKPNEVQRQALAHERYAQSRLYAYLPLQAFEAMIRAALSQGLKGDGSQVLLVTAPSGFGKSAFLAHLAREMQKGDGKNGLGQPVLFSHYVGADGPLTLSAWFPSSPVARVPEDASSAPVVAEGSCLLRSEGVVRRPS